MYMQFCLYMFIFWKTNKQNIPLTLRAIEETPRSIYTIMDIFTLAQELTQFICHHNHQFNSINHNFVLKSVSPRVCIMKQMQKIWQSIKRVPEKYFNKTSFEKVSVVKTKSLQNSIVQQKTSFIYNLCYDTHTSLNLYLNVFRQREAIIMNKIYYETWRSCGYIYWSIKYNNHHYTRYR